MDTKSEERVKFLTEKGAEFSKDLTTKATKWEVDFKKKLIELGVDFVFQHPVVCNKRNLFILDFYLPEYGLAIELDGKRHYTRAGASSDRRRTACLQKEGIQVMRFSNQKAQSLTVKHLREMLSLLNKKK